MKLIKAEHHLELHAETTWDREITAALLKAQTVKVLSLDDWGPDERNKICLAYPRQDW